MPSSLCNKESSFLICLVFYGKDNRIRVQKLTEDSKFNYEMGSCWYGRDTGYTNIMVY